MTKTALILAAAIAASSSASIAQTIQQAPSVRVSYADLDLTQKAGRATLEARVTRAVSRLCKMPAASDLGAMSRYRDCRKDAWTGARPQMAAVYEGARYANRASTEMATQVQ